jgi:hypothetical protein
LNDACPEAKSALPSAVTPSLKVTFPVGEAVPLTVAVKVTLCSAMICEADALRLVAVAAITGGGGTAWLTVTATGAEVEAALFASPA